MNYQKRLSDLERINLNERHDLSKLSDDELEFLSSLFSKYGFSGEITLSELDEADQKTVESIYKKLV